MTRLPPGAAAVLRLLVAAALVGAVVATTDVSQAARGVRRLSWGVLVLGVALMVLWNSLNSLRWGIVLRGLGHAQPARLTWSVGMIGLFFSQFLPSSVGGDAVRVALMARRGVPLGVSLGGTLTDRALALLFIAVAVLLAAPATAQRLADWRLTALVCGAALAVTLAGALPLLPVDWHGLLPRPLKALAGPVEHYRSTLLRGPGRPALGLLCAASYVMPCLVFYAFARDLGVGLALTDCLLLVPPVVLASALPLSFAGWGVREVSVVGLFGAAGIAPEDALVLSVAFGATVAAAGLIGGVVWQVSGLRRAAAPGGATAG
ncbi:MAG: flippase-like domain-containing protein [Rhodospirillaceae bacterium]|nr:flippase-like domain-containing protein [Rhodospirillaceae bacterium]